VTTYVVLRFDDQLHAGYVVAALRDELVVVDDRTFPDSSPTTVRATVVGVHVRETS
jgi:hypothetical protein